MEIKIVLHSELDCPLKPDLHLIMEALEEIRDINPTLYNELYFVHKLAESASDVHKEIENADCQIKVVQDEEYREALKKFKKEKIKEYDALVEKAFKKLCAEGAGDYYHYKFDDHFNKIVAGLMGSTCYMKDTFAELQNKRIDNILAIANLVGNNGHHSCFDHATLTLQITGLKKAFAMVLNNEQDYAASEKSARFTEPNDMDAIQGEKYYKWLEIFKDEIAEYGKGEKFFTESKITKLAQENARYMLSVFTPTNECYTASFRQLNYIYNWCKQVIADPNVNGFYQEIKPDMQDFVDFMDYNHLHIEELVDNKNRKFSLFGPSILKESIISPNYALKHKITSACLAQVQRHRPVCYNIIESQFMKSPMYYVPPVIAKYSDLRSEWLSDISEHPEIVPQGLLLPVVESGQIAKFLLKAEERVCMLAQKETRDLTQNTCLKLANALGKELIEIDKLLTKKPHDAELLEIQENTLSQYQKLQGLSQTARCVNGYKCKEPCGFKKGILLESEV